MKSTTETERISYTVRECIDATGISKTRIYAAIRSGQLPARKFGKRTLVIVDDLKTFLNRLPSIPPRSI